MLHSDGLCAWAGSVSCRRRATKPPPSAQPLITCNSDALGSHPTKGPKFWDSQSITGHSPAALGTPVLFG